MAMHQTTMKRHGRPEGGKRHLPPLEIGLSQKFLENLRSAP